jgi:23S rRNA G2069 N7-methylase RlmK/C1962 C5-methylase RlmI
MVSRAKENAQLSGLSDAKIRYIVDDAVKIR